MEAKSMNAGNRGRDKAMPFDQASWQALRASLADARGLPAAWRAVLLDEATDLLDAVTRHQAALRPAGILTRRGLVKAAYRDYLALQPRLERVLALLGLDDDGKPEKAPVDPRAAVRAEIERLKGVTS